LPGYLKREELGEDRPPCPFTHALPACQFAASAWSKWQAIDGTLRRAGLRLAAGSGRWQPCRQQGGGGAAAAGGFTSQRNVDSSRAGVAGRDGALCCKVAKRSVDAAVAGFGKGRRNKAWQWLIDSQEEALKAGFDVVVCRAPGLPATYHPKIVLSHDSQEGA
jgi:hypothetical protein